MEISNHFFKFRISERLDFWFFNLNKQYYRPISVYFKLQRKLIPIRAVPGSLDEIDDSRVTFTSINL